jgi:hypothetical protein
LGKSKKEVNVPVLVIGNGESRKELDLSLYIKNFTTVGCNAIHRDFAVDHLVCCDQRMVEESIKNPNIANSKVYTRARWLNTNLRYRGDLNPLPELPFIGSTKPDDDFNWGSGPYSVLLGCNLSNEIILIGFDLFSNTNHVNNVYKDTNNYLSSTASSVDPAFWIYQIEKLFEHFKDHNFICLNNDSWTPPESWKKQNVRFRNYKFLERMVDIINTDVV